MSNYQHCFTDKELKDYLDKHDANLQAALEAELKSYIEQNLCDGDPLEYGSTMVAATEVYEVMKDYIAAVFNKGDSNG